MTYADLYNLGMILFLSEIGFMIRWLHEFDHPHNAI